MSRIGLGRHVMFAVASPGSIGRASVRKVSTLALALDAEVELFHCIFDEDIARPGRFGTRGVQKDIQLRIEDRHRQLERAAEKFRVWGARVRTSVRWDYPIYDGIVRQVLRHKPDLLIVESKPRSRMARALSTATDYKLIQVCPCPVLFIKTARPYSAPQLLAAVDPQQAHRKPDALDGEILRHVTLLRSALSGQLQILHASEPWEDVLRTNAQLRAVPEVEKNDVYSAYHGAIESKVRALTRRYAIADKHVHIVEGDPAEVLTRFAKREKPDIVVIGAVARSRLKRALIGHTAEKVLDALDSDVLIIKTSQFRSPVSRQSTHHVDRSIRLRARTVW